MTRRTTSINCRAPAWPREAAKLALLLWPDATVAALRSMTRLVSFSLTVTPCRVAIDFWLPRRAVTQLAAGLPASCVEIEINPRGWDVALSRTEPHLCDVLRAALPPLAPFAACG